MNQILTLSACTSIALLAFLFADAPVPQADLDRFARRHHLTPTENSSSQVATYIRVTRRWRIGCLFFAICLSVVTGLMQQQLNLNVTAVIAGLFAAVLLAEIRMAGLTPGRRMAALTPRRLRDYLHRTGRIALTTALVVAVPLSVLVLFVGRGDLKGLWVAILTPAVVGTISVWSMHRTLRRAQRAADPDQVEADNAIRRQSVQTLAACAMALIAYALINQLTFLLDTAEAPETAILLIPIGLVVVPWFARSIATRPSPAAP